VARDDCKTSHEKSGCKKDEFRRSDTVMIDARYVESKKHVSVVECSLVEFRFLFHLSFVTPSHNFLTSNKI